MKKNFIAAAICGLSLLASGTASAVVVGGVDFGTLGLTQHFETSDVFETYIDGVGQALTGYGQITKVNGTGSYAAGGQTLYFVFKNYNTTAFTPASASFNGGVIDVYLGTLGNLFNQSSSANITAIQGLTKFVELTGHAKDSAGNTLTANGQLTGASLSFTGAGLLDASNSAFSQGDVYRYLNSNTVSDLMGGFADIIFTSSGNNFVKNTNDTCTPKQGEFCFAGSADFRGDTVAVPEPSILALLGLGLLGMGASLRKRKSV